VPEGRDPAHAIVLKICNHIKDLGSSSEKQAIRTSKYDIDDYSIGGA
jgi:hypothetical protein